MGLNKRLIGGAGGAAGGESTDNFSVITYTGSGSTQSTNSLSSQSGTVDFPPDLVWIKDRGNAESHQLFDSIRGAGEVIESDDNAVEVTRSDSLTSFNSNGFTLGSDSAGFVNYSSRGPYVAWCWRAAGAANTFNVLEGGTVTSDSTASGAGITAGTTTAGWEVSANRDAGFSIVKYTAGGSANVGHGLSQAPELIINKTLDGSLNWVIYSADVGTQNFGLFTGAAFSSNSGTWSAVDANTFTTNINSTSYTYINYCFHSVDGYQKVGTYSGTGTGTNPIATGFIPRFVMIKRTDSTGHWVMIDLLRENGDKWLYANTSNAEYDDANLYTEISATDGFIVYGSSGYVNASGTNNYIYLAIA